MGKRKSATALKDPTCISKTMNKKPCLSKMKDYFTTVTILESISDAIFILDEDGRIRYANKGALDLLRIDINNLLGKFIDEILIDDFNSNENISIRKSEDFSKNYELLEKFNKGIFGNIETSMINNGYVIPVILNFNVINSGSGELKYIIVTVKNISHWKILEKELKQQQALSISRDRLRSLGELSVGLVHELSQPLSALLFKVEDMGSLVKNNKEQEKKIEEMLDDINRISSKIHQIRTYANQTEDETIALVNINEVIDKASALVAYELKNYNIELTIKRDKHLPYILVNPLVLEQVFVNLLTNSRDAFSIREESCEQPEDRVKEIEIVTKSRDNWIEISVEDNAGGIDEKIKEKIFDPFFTTKGPGINSGVGLSISKNIITSLGGDIRVIVKKEIGSKFIIRIPVIQDDEQLQLFNFIEMLH